MLNENVSNYCDLESVLLDLNVSTHDVMPTKRCVEENLKHQKTIVLVPYRNRTENLKLFISPLHQHLMNQEKPDVPYLCLGRPTLLSVSIEKFKFTLPYPHYFGGVVSLTLDQFMSLNGMSKRYWGWGGEDDDFYNRLKEKKLGPMHLSGKQGRYKSLEHKQNTNTNKNRWYLITNGTERMSHDGINQTRYQVINKVVTDLYTKISVNLLNQDYIKTHNDTELSLQFQKKQKEELSQRLQRR